MLKLLFFHFNDIIGYLAQILKSSLEAERKKCRLAIVNFFLIEDRTAVEILLSVEIPNVSRIKASSSGVMGMLS